MDFDFVEVVVNEWIGVIMVIFIYGYFVDLDCLDVIWKKYFYVVILQDCVYFFVVEWKGCLV